MSWALVLLAGFLLLMLLAVQHPDLLDTSVPL